MNVRPIDILDYDLSETNDTRQAPEQVERIQDSNLVRAWKPGEAEGTECEGNH